MKRKDILSTVKEVDIDSVIEQDGDFLDKMISDKKYELSTAKRGIKAFLKNPDLVMNEEFITLIANKTRLERAIESYTKVKEEYL